MSSNVCTSQERLTDGKAKKLLLPIIVLLTFVAMAVDTKVVRIGSHEDARANAFSAEQYGKKQFPVSQAAIEKNAVELKELLGALSQDKESAAEKYGKPGSVGPIFPVKFSGVVGEGSSGVFTVKIEGAPSDMVVRVQTGPAINGTEVRDATGTIEFGQFTNQIEYQDAGAALNNEIKTSILAGLDREHLPGKTIDVVGVFQLINPANLLVTPVQLKVSK